MSLSQIVEAVKEHFLGVVVLSLYFFFSPAYYVEKYRSWPQTDSFIISSSLFFIFIFLYITIAIEHRFVSDAIFPLMVREAYGKIVAKIKPSLNWASLFIRNYIALFIKFWLLIFGVATSASIFNLYAQFQINKNPFFWNFIGNYLINFIFITFLMILASQIFKYICKIENQYN